MPKVPHSEIQLRAQLKEQLEFIERSCESYDNGFASEAKRLALAVRILLHDTRHSESLLGQLGLLDLSFCDTLSPLTGVSMIPEMGLIVQHAGRKGFEYVAPLDNVPSLKQASFSNWWQDVICKMPDGDSVSRRSLVLTAADQDGGAHVDPSLDELYYKFVHQNGLGFMVGENGSGPQPMGDPTKAALRQIAHEVLKTLVDGYGKSFVPSGMMVAGISISTTPPPSIAAIHYQGPNGTKTPANVLCPCGSGLPYKSLIQKFVMRSNALRFCA